MEKPTSGFPKKKKNKHRRKDITVNSIVADAKPNRIIFDFVQFKFKKNKNVLHFNDRNTLIAFFGHKICSIKQRGIRPYPA